MPGNTKSHDSDNIDVAISGPHRYDFWGGAGGNSYIIAFLSNLIDPDQDGSYNSVSDASAHV